MSLSQLLDKSQQDSMGDDQSTWRQFILDHLDYIAKNSRRYDIDANQMTEYRYDLKRYLKNELTLHFDIAWIVLLLNDLFNDFDFDQPGIYVIPNDRLINDLYHTYITISANQK